ncbi:MAG TPA: hypothetical protein VF926_13860 [Mycobacterium sp.]
MDGTNGLRHHPAVTVGGRFALQWAAGGSDITSDPGVALAVTSMVSLRPFRREFLLPTKLTDDELRRISAPTTVLLGDREIIYAGGPQAALARADAHSQRACPSPECRPPSDARRSRRRCYRDDGALT